MFGKKVKTSIQVFLICTFIYLCWLLSNIISLKSNIESNYIENNDNSCIISFIDDDTGQYIPEIWGPIIDSTDIKMGFACITGFMGADNTPEVFAPISIDYLRKLYSDGHDVYSHSNTHQEFYVDSVTLECIEWQCQESKKWMQAQGFTRSNNIIVYPGGLGRPRIGVDFLSSIRNKREKDNKRNVIKRYYEYGVDATGFDDNLEPIDNWYIKRVNADTASIATLKMRVNDAIEDNGLLIFMNHAYELNKNKEAQISKMIELINYIKEKQIQILPLSQALIAKGNVCYYGDYESSNALYISKNGSVHFGLFQYMLISFVVFFIIIVFFAVHIYKIK